MIIIIRISNKLNYVVCFISRKHLLTKTSRSRFHSQMFNHNNKYPRYKETNEQQQQTNFLTEKVIEHRTLHLYQRYLSFDNLNQISWNYTSS